MNVSREPLPVLRPPLPRQHGLPVPQGLAALARRSARRDTTGAVPGTCRAQARGRVNEEREGIIGAAHTHLRGEHAPRRTRLQLHRLLQAVRYLHHLARAYARILRFDCPSAGRARSVLAGPLDGRARMVRRGLVACAVVLGGLVLAPSVGAAYPRPPSWWLRQAACIRRAESMDGRLSGNRYQFLDSTWRSVGGVDDPATAPRPEQDYRAWLVYRRDGGSWREWSTARLCGLR